ncbi:MBL fold metallo-hydrolase [Bacteroidota bacterium]
MRRLFLLYLLAVLFLSQCKRLDNSVYLTYYGHSCFEFKYAGKRILIDPFTPEWFDYIQPAGQFDYVISSHSAKDHNYIDSILCENILLASGETDEFLAQIDDSSYIKVNEIKETIQGNQLSVKTVASFHDEIRGARNGVNGITCFRFNDISVVHLGDIGHVLYEDQMERTGQVDVLMIPVDSYHIIDLDSAIAIIEQLNPRIVIPIHYKTVKCKNDFDDDDLEKFLSHFENIKRCNCSSLNLTKLKYKNKLTVLLMDYLTCQK